MIGWERAVCKNELFVTGVVSQRGSSLILNVTLTVSETRSFCNLHWTVARGCLHLSWLPQEHRSWGAAGQGSVLCTMDSGSLYEEGRAEWGLDADVSSWVSWAGRLLGRGIWSPLQKVSVARRIVKIFIKSSGKFNYSYDNNNTTCKVPYFQVIETIQRFIVNITN